MYVEQYFRRARRVDAVVGVLTTLSFKNDAQKTWILAVLLLCLIARYVSHRDVYPAV